MAVARPPRGADRRNRPFWSRLHFLVRFLGLTGLLVAGVGLVLAQQDGLLASWDTAVAAGRVVLDRNFDDLGACLVVGGGAAALLALVVEGLVLLRYTAGRRNVFGLNAAVQVALAAALLVGVNWWSGFWADFTVLGHRVAWQPHYLRLDWTREGLFTLPQNVREQLATLDRSVPTTVVVLQRHKTFGSLSDKPDRYDYAAERKVVEKVKDLVDQLREVGPQFRVEVLDVEEERFDKRLDELAAEAPELRKAIDATPENSLFFYAKGDKGAGRVQRLGFNDFYLLDKTASQEGRGNLVLRSQGVEPFARRVLSLEEKPPKVAIAVIHEVLTTAGQDDYGLQGLKKALVDRGSEVQDIVLKKWSRFAPPEPGAFTPEERKLSQLEEREMLLKLNLAALERNRTQLEAEVALWRKAVDDDAARKELTRRYARQLRGRAVTAALAANQLPVFEEDLQDLKEGVEIYRKRLADVREEIGKLNVPALAESRRETDVKARLDRFLADCDLLIVPRMTLRNTAVDFDNIPARLYRLDDPQVEAVKDFLKAGKPVFACFGPSNQPPDEAARPGADDNKPEPLEELFGALGIRFGKQTVLFDEETDAFADRRSGLEFTTAAAKVPPVLLDWRPGAGRPVGAAQPPADPNPIRQSLRLTARSLGRDAQGKERTLELRLRHPRPVYYVPPEGVEPAKDPDFLQTSPRSWNEDQPFPTADRVPQFERPKPREGEKPPPEPADPLEARRRGPFPVGVAVEAKLPAAWGVSPPKTVRVAAVGQGGFFTGKELPPAQETLMLDTINWLLGRDDYLPQEGKAWSYPRVALDESAHPRERTEWLLGARLGLPVLCAYLGFVVLLVRRLR